MGRLQRETGTVRKKDLHMKPFETSLLGRMELNNRIGIPAMCTYMAKGDGIANLHHIAHYETLAKDALPLSYKRQRPSQQKAISVTLV